MRPRVTLAPAGPVSLRVKGRGPARERGEEGAPCRPWAMHSSGGRKHLGGKVSETVVVNGERVADDDVRPVMRVYE